MVPFLKKPFLSIVALFQPPVTPTPPTVPCFVGHGRGDFIFYSYFSKKQRHVKKLIIESPNLVEVGSHLPCGNWFSPSTLWKLILAFYHWIPGSNSCLSGFGPSKQARCNESNLKMSNPSHIWIHLLEVHHGGIHVGTLQLMLLRLPTFLPPGRQWK